MARPAIRIIAMSGGGQIHTNVYLSMARQLGANATLSKPFTASGLLEIVEEQLKAALPHL